MYADIYKALNTRLASYQATLQASPYKMHRMVPEGEVYRQKGRPYIKQLHIPLENGPSSIGTSGDTMLQGIYRLIVNYPSDSGTSGATAMAELLVGKDASSGAAFYKGQNLTSGGAVVNIHEAKIASSNEDGSWYRVSLTVQWYSHSHVN